MAPHHPLDRPVWHALTTRQAALARGDARAVRMDADYGLFAAAADASPESLAALTALVPADASIGIVEVDPFPSPPGTLILKASPCWQMVATAITPAPRETEYVVLTDADAPEMLALATLTEPGPFFRRTHRLGRFIGVKHDGRLVAMAGERLALPGYREVSGVCTHPDHRGHGYAGGLMRIVAQAMLARGDTPFLHAYAANRAATALYETLGFRLRRELTFAVLTALPADAT